MPHRLHRFVSSISSLREFHASSHGNHAKISKQTTIRYHRLARFLMHPLIAATPFQPPSPRTGSSAADHALSGGGHVERGRRRRLQPSAITNGLSGSPLHEQHVAVRVDPVCAFEPKSIHRSRHQLLKLAARGVLRPSLTPSALARPLLMQVQVAATARGSACQNLEGSGREPIRRTAKGIAHMRHRRPRPWNSKV
jgi:hypothetical protein